MKLDIQKKNLVALTAAGMERKFKFPAVAVSIKGERIEAASPVHAHATNASGALGESPTIK